MFGKLKGLVRNHWKKVVVGGVVVQGLIVGAKYATNRFLQYHESQTLVLLQNMRREKHFESMEPTFKSSFVALAISLRETVLECIDAEKVADELKALVSSEMKVKVEMWETLKVMGFTRILVIIYGTSLLNILLRIQLSIIGGNLFLESNQPDQSNSEWRNVDGIIMSNNTAIDKDLQQKYLALASHLVKQGIRKLCHTVYSKTSDVVKSVSLKQKITITELEQIFLSITTGIHNDIVPQNTASIPLPEVSSSPVKCPWKYVFPPEVLEAHDNFRKLPNFRPHYEPPDMYERLLSDTFDLLDSDDVVGLMTTFERQGIRNFCDRLAEAIAPEPLCNGNLGNDSTNHILPDTEVGIPMAKIIPILNRLVAQGVQTENDPWLSVLSNSDLTRTLATNVYESFSNVSPEY